jgi:hypothetical protein
MIFNIPLHQIDEALLQSLVDTLEDRQVEFKEVLPSKDSGDIIKKFLKPVSAMANTLGGDVIYGIKEAKNAEGHTVAGAIVGIPKEDPDDVKQRLENLLRTSVDPRIIGYTIHPVRLANGNFVYIVRVLRSWNPPHVVKHGDHWRFYYRNSAGSHPMDVTELHHAFTFSDTLSQKLEEFRLERLAKIAADEKIGTGPKVALHIQPFSSVDPTAHVDFIRTKSIGHYPFITANYGSYTSRVNYHGFFEYMDWSEKRNYLQIFRTGKLEAVSGDLVGEGRVRQPFFEERILAATHSYLKLLRSLGVTAPLLLHLSLLGVKGYTVGEGTVVAGATPEWKNIEENDLLLPGELIESYEDSPPRILKSSFDAVWNAAGSEGSPYYEGDDNWQAN